ncbi:MAG TPA: prolyl oligopeptidase family serine peptidase [Gemmatimonadaceae bacterium]|nr:prolyl oligopeptidase family serine peptidase [Gemmatimonadaceae bacterium]
MPTFDSRRAGAVRIAAAVVLARIAVLAALAVLAVLTAPAAPAQSTLPTPHQAVAGASPSSAPASDSSILAAEQYERPPAVIERLVTAPRENNVSLSAATQSPDRRRFYKLVSAGMPSVTTFGKPHYYLGELQVDYLANRARSLTDRGAARLDLIDGLTGSVRQIAAPAGATLSSPAWSPDGARIAYIANFANDTRLYVADVATGRTHALGSASLLATLVTEPQWTADGRSIVAVVIPDDRKSPPAEPAIATGPEVRMTDGKKDKTRVYATLLQGPHDAALLEYYITGQLALINAKSGAVHRVGAPAMIDDVDPSPDGRYFRVTLVRKPFSYIVPMTSFARSEELWDANGRTVTQLTEQAARLSDDRDAQSPAERAAADTVSRGFTWLPDGSGLAYLKQDPAPQRGEPDSSGEASASERGSGAAGRAARRKDHLYAWAPPFDAASRRELFTSDNRMGSVLFSADAKMAFVAENVSGTGHVYAVYFNEPTKRYTIWRLRGLNASVGGGRRFFGGGGRGGNGADSVTFYENPGALMTTPSRAGVDVALLSPDGSAAYLEGTHYNRDWEHQAPRGFVDRVEIRTGKKTPVFEGAADVSETVTAALDDSLSKVIVERQSPTMVPDAWLRDAASGQSMKQLTHNMDVAPEFTHAVRKRIWVTRADGYRFLVNLTLPEGYQAGTRLPAMFWFYPYEYTDEDGYLRTLRTENINEFPRSAPRTIEYLVTQGYAVADFDPPIVGEQGRMNDNYVNDLRNNLYAVIDELDRDGFIDRTRLAIGGHSYGAFSTVNAMVHTAFFKAGIAGDGMYNRSLTPNGFQNERRDFWSGQKAYLDMSPFLYADKLSGALLMYHSLEDQNVGTALESSTRMLHALQGLGKTAALYMYPYEDHGPLTRETVLDQWARWVAWLDRYVKNSSQVAASPVVKAAGQ